MMDGIRRVDAVRARQEDRRQWLAEAAPATGAPRSVLPSVARRGHLRAGQVSPTWLHLGQPEDPDRMGCPCGSRVGRASGPLARWVLIRDSVPPRYRLIIVQRERIGVFRTLLASAHRWPAGTAIMLDRRYADRRTRTQQVLTERRQGARRAEPEAHWYSQGFIVVEVTTLPTQAAILRPFLSAEPAAPAGTR